MPECVSPKESTESPEACQESKQRLFFSPDILFASPLPKLHDNNVFGYTALLEQLFNPLVFDIFFVFLPK